MAERTPGPWRLDQTGISVYILPPNGAYVATLPIPHEYWHDREYREQKCEAIANAAFIVKAVNHHDALVAALQTMIAMACYSNSPDHDQGDIDSARAVLAALEDRT